MLSLVAHGDFFLTETQTLYGLLRGVGPRLCAETIIQAARGRGEMPALVGEALDKGLRPPADVMPYVTEIRRLRTLREIMRAGEDLRQSAGRSGADPLALAEQHMERVRQVVASTGAGATWADPLGGVVLESVKEEPVDYIWPGWIPKLLTLIAGEEGIGKGLFIAMVAARITTGRAFADGAAPRKGKVLWFSGEDTAAQAVKPRVRMAGGDCSNVIIYEDVFALDEKGVAKLDVAIARYRPQWVVFDPALSYFPAGKNPNNPVDVRSVTSPLNKICRERDCGITVLLHFNKAKGEGDPRKAVMSSGEWRNASRSSLYFAEHPKHKGARAFYQQKVNYGPLQKSGVAYEVIALVDEEAEPVDGKQPTVGFFREAGNPKYTLEECLAPQLQRPSDESALAEAVDFYRQILTGPPVPSQDLNKQAKYLGLSAGTLAAARRKEQIECRKFGNGTKQKPICWFTARPNQWPANFEENYLEFAPPSVRKETESPEKKAGKAGGN